MYRYAKEKAPKPEIAFYTPEDIMTIMQISRTSVYKLFNSDGFPAIKIGGIYRVEKAQFDTWVKQYTGKEFLF